MPQPIDPYEPSAIEAKWQARWERDALHHASDDDPRPKWYALTMFPYPSGDLHIGHWYAYTPHDAHARFMRMRGYNVMNPFGFDAFGLPAENAAIKRGIHPRTWTLSNIERMRGQIKQMGASFDWEREVICCLPEYYRWNQWFFVQMFKRGLAYRAKAPANWCPKDQTVLANEQVKDGRCERCGTIVERRDLEQWFFRITKYADRLLDFSGLLDWPEKIKIMQRNWIGRSEGVELSFDIAHYRLDQKAIKVFTTRPDTVFGVTFLVLAPEHPLVEKLTTPDRKRDVDAYIQQARRASEIERMSTEREKTGVPIGAHCVNPFNGERVPIYIADYVLMGYGTGAVMAVPAHDERDFQFALKYGLPVLPVLERPDGLTKSFAMKRTMREGFADALRSEGIPFEDKAGHLFITIPQAKVGRYVKIARAHLQPGSWNELVGGQWLFLFDDGVVEWDSFEAEKRILARCKAVEPNVRNRRTLMEMLHSVEFYRDALFHDAFGTMVNSGRFDGTPGDKAFDAVAAYAEQQGIGKRTISYRIRDWLISRQRYWGTPIPIIYCPKCGTLPLPEKDLPVLLPDDAEFKPTGESPLARHPTFPHVKCPQCGGDARRETDTMDTFVDSSWYFLRYTSPGYHAAAFDSAKARKWMPVDQYTGGAEHAVMHLLYSRFFVKALHDMDVVAFDEPFLRLFNQGIILGEDHEKMSKSRGNVVNPDDFVKNLGADAVRTFLMFVGPWDQGASWSTMGIQGMSRWLNRVWAIGTHDPAELPSAVRGEPVEPRSAQADPMAVEELRRATHKTIRRVTADLEKFQFNTQIAALMEFTNHLGKAWDAKNVDRDSWRDAISTLLLMVAPTTPHLAEELWARTGHAYSVHQQPWPKYDESLARDREVTLVVQVNGKLRDKLTVAPDISEAEATRLALASDKVKASMDGKQVRKVVYVPGKLVNVVVG
ncbi:MAG: leucine--tRNA ligase [Chloroflexi bacterium]|nr:leucine--tRNA ligase [Chloroflexota bacterium]